jgi:hypothetical protein
MLWSGSIARTENVLGGATAFRKKSLERAIRGRNQKPEPMESWFVEFDRQTKLDPAFTRRPQTYLAVKCEQHLDQHIDFSLTSGFCCGYSLGRESKAVLNRHSPTGTHDASDSAFASPFPVARSAEAITVHSNLFLPLH